jgi:hypothetical protein
MDRLPVRYAALTCVIAGGLLVSGPGLVASADDGTSGGTSSDTSSTSHNWLSSLSSVPGLNFLSGLGTANVPTIGPVAPPLMNLPNLSAPSTAPNGPGLVQAFMLPDPGNTHPITITVRGSTPRTPGGEKPGKSPDVGSQPADSDIADIAPRSEVHNRGENTSPPISLVPFTPSGVPAGPPISQLLPPPLVMLLTAILKHVPIVGQEITALLNMTVPPFIANFIDGLTATPATMPAALSVANPALLSPSGPPPADVAPMGMDVPAAPAQGPTSPTGEPAGPPTAPDNRVSIASEPVAFRAGYSDYLRNAGLAQITAIAVPGAVAILLFSMGGGFIGYRQARAGHIIRAEGIARFLR